MFKKIQMAILTGLTSLIVTACTQVGVGIANLPAKFADMEIKNNLAYGEKDWQKLDLYVPEQAKETSLPVIVYFYGGGYTEGSKDMYDFVGDAFAKEGYIVAVADYGKYPDVPFPDFVKDGAKAISWVYKNIEEHGGDKNNLFIVGHSAGAHIGALVHANENYLKAEGLNSKKVITAFAGMAGPYDFVPQAEIYKEIFGPPSNYRNMQVPKFIEGDEPPMYLLWGAKDTVVYRRNLDRLEDKIKKQNGDVEIKIYENLDHVGIVSSLTWFLKGRAPVLKDITEFFDKHKR